MTCMTQSNLSKYNTADDTNLMNFQISFKTINKQINHDTKII